MGLYKWVGLDWILLRRLVLLEHLAMLILRRLVLLEHLAMLIISWSILKSVITCVCSGETKFVPPSSSRTQTRNTDTWYIVRLASVWWGWLFFYQNGTSEWWRQSWSASVGCFRDIFEFWDRGWRHDLISSFWNSSKTWDVLCPFEF